jgi:hypothetical protein
MVLTPKAKPANMFHSYATAADYARSTGGRIQCVTVSGGPKTFVVEVA